MIRYKLNEEIEIVKNSYQNLNEGIQYEELLQYEEERIRKLSAIEQNLKLQCQKYAQKIEQLEKEIQNLQTQIVRIYRKS